MAMAILQLDVERFTDVPQRSTWRAQKISHTAAMRHA
jgi:hypothetical protein